MNHNQWEDWLRANYPDTARVIHNDGRSLHYDEIVAEQKEPGLAVAVIVRSPPHFHRQTTEYYKIVQGELAVVAQGTVSVLTEGVPGSRKCSIMPGIVHNAVSLTNEPAVIEVRADPPWSPDDHFEV